MVWLTNIAYLIAGVGYLPVLLYQMVVQRKNRRGWRQRCGHLHLPQPQGPRIWIHAVSLGEVNCTPALAQGLAEAIPGSELVVSTTTDTGYARACRLYPPERVFRYPLDFSWTMGRAFDRVKPSLLVLVELELWPNLLRLARHHGVPVAVVNGRLTERSATRMSWLGGFARSMFAELAWVGAQDETIAERFRRLGAPPENVELAGSLKWDTAEITDSVPGAEALAAALGLPTDRPLWVCGSTGPGEEALILEAHKRLIAEGGDAISLAIVPRKPERFDEVAALVRRGGFDCVRRSERPDGSPATTPAERAVFLGDTMGELRKLYTLARAVFVGRSLVPMGGSDPMEVAALAKPIIVGPHMDNFRMPVDRLADRQALYAVSTPGELAAVVRRLVSDPGEAGKRARSVVRENQGATARTVEALAGLLTGGRARTSRR
ncbi:MAG: 3-deoxy-D-manno-octulosonic acid transferase [bacterium]|nr:3-deoxy-D-manno-octulosonic acid transferase [bacterium]